MFKMPLSKMSGPLISVAVGANTTGNLYAVELWSKMAAFEVGVECIAVHTLGDSEREVESL